MNESSNLDRRAFLERFSFGSLGLLAAPALINPLLHRGSTAGASSRPATLGLDGARMVFDTPEFTLRLVEASQTVAALHPKAAEDDFSFTPTDRLEQRDGDGFYHLGDLTLRLRGEEGQWTRSSTAAERAPVKALPAPGSTLAAADLNPSLPDDLPLAVERHWDVVDGQLALRFKLRNRSSEPVEIGALGIPMVFNNILHERSLDEAHMECSFYDPCIGQDAGYLQVTRLNGDGPALVVTPEEGTPLEAYHPLLDDETPRGITFEGFYEWMPHSQAYAEGEWSEAEPWNPPSSETLDPGEERTYGVQFLVADSIRGIEPRLLEADHPLAVGLPGYVVSTDRPAKLYLSEGARVDSIDVAPAGALTVREAEATENGWQGYRVRGQDWGRARVTVTYDDGREQTISYKVIKPEREVAGDLGRFATTEQWFDESGDRFNRNPSVISYDYDEGRPVLQEQRAWIAGLSDEGGAGAWLVAVMKQLVDPNPEEIRKVEQFVEETVWGTLQYSEGDRQYGVRKSLFFYEPDEMPEGTYSPEVGYGGWASWDTEEAHSVTRSFNYVHVSAAYWVLYHLARHREGLVSEKRTWRWYLQQASRTARAMTQMAHYAEFGQMEGTVFVEILRDLKREGLGEESEALEAAMRERADEWESLNYPFGSEMPWDSTGQEEVYAWCDYFGYDEKAQVTLDAILGYMPTVAHWGYNGSARRYWDFMFAGKLSRLERQLHHYGSGLNAIPVLNEYRKNPDDLYLLRVGYGGLMGSIANVTQEGFGPCGFHAYPSTLRIDGYSGDYGSNFFGHAINTGTYAVEHPEFGPMAFGGTVSTEGDWVRVSPRDSARSRVYLAPLGLWLTLESGTFESVAYDAQAQAVQLQLAEAPEHTPRARLRVEQPAEVEGVGTFAPRDAFDEEREAYVIPLGEGATAVRLGAA